MKIKLWIKAFLLILGLSLMVAANAEEFIEEFDQNSFSSDWETVPPVNDHRQRIEDGFLSVTLEERSVENQDETLQCFLRPIAKGDWTTEARIIMDTPGDGYETGIIIWTNPDISHRWGIRCDGGKSNPKYYSCFMNFDDFKEERRYSPEINEKDITLRVIRIGTKLELQYWEEEQQDYTTYVLASYKFPINKVGVYLKQLGSPSVSIRYDYIKVIR